MYKKHEFNCVICGKKIIKKSIYENTCSDNCLKKYNEIDTKERHNIIVGEVIYKDNVKEDRWDVSNYKEPFIKVSDEFYGYQGAIIKDKETGMLQCHICGNWYKHLGMHVTSKHKNVIEKHRIYKDESYSKTYKRMFGLKEKTALCTETIREKCIQSQLKMPWERFQKHYDNLLQSNIKNKYKRKRNKDYQSTEKDNENGTCYLQTLDFISNMAIQLDRTPAMLDVPGRIRKAVKRHFGTWNNAIEILHLEKNKTFINHGKLTPEFLLQSMRNLTENKKRRPVRSDCNNKALPRLELYIEYFGSWDKAKLLAFKK